MKNLEDELVRCTTVKDVKELTKSKSLSNFKAEFKKMRKEECRHALERHKINIRKLWMTKAQSELDFIQRNSEKIKITDVMQ